jgi:hypothetical protein
MPLSLHCVNEKANYPRPMMLALECDGDHGLFPVKQSFTHKDGFGGCYSAAMRAGWKDTSASGARLFLCPGCSRKAAR